MEIEKTLGYPIAVTFIMCMALSAGPAVAQVKKCIGPDGKVTYSDFLCAGSTAKQSEVTLHSNTMESSAMRQESQRQRIEQSAADALAANPKQCSFTYFQGDTKGQALAKNAKAECLTNLQAKAAGQSTVLDDYEMWKDHNAQKTSTVNAALSRAAAARNAQAIANSNAQAIDAAARQSAMRPLKCKKSMTPDTLDCQ